MKKIDFLKERLERYYDAETRILEGQSYRLGSRELTRANLKQVQDKIKELESQIDALEKNGTTKRKVYRVTPMDY